jgi:Xaa-Pro aminopeptidase
VKIPQAKIDTIQSAMVADGFDVIFSRLSVNVLFFTGHWSGNHAVAAIVPASGRPTLLVAETEYDDAVTDLDRETLDIETYAFESATVLRGITDSMAASALPAILRRMGVSDGVIGVEMSFEDGALGRLMGDFKYPAKPTWDVLRATFPQAELKDASGLISRLRWVKTPPEVEAIKKAIRIASLGFAAAQEAAEAGMTEAELSAVLEREILTQGTGRNGADFSRGFPSIYSGPRSALQNTHWACSSGRVIQENEIVIMELGSVTDGYWCDLTRHACAGVPPRKAQEIYEIALEAQRRGIAAAKPGVPVGEIDKACHAYIAEAGYGDRFPHASGHGVGYNYHEGPPVHRAFDAPLEEGMVLCVEPGIYLPGEFGLRPEDIILITQDGAERLSDHPHTL